MSNLLEHLKEMKSQAELVDDWQKAFDVAISLCTKKDTVIAELQKENERLHEQIRVMRLGYTKSIEYDLSPAMVESKLRTHLIEQMGWMPPEDIATLQEKYDNLKLENERLNSPVLKSEWQQLQEKCDNLKEENVKLAEEYLTAGIQKIIAQEKYDKLKLGSERYREALEIETVGRVLAEKHRNILQEKYDKLKERVEGAQREPVYKVKGVFLVTEAQKRYPDGDCCTVALVELKPNEIDSCHTSGNG